MMSDKNNSSNKSKIPSEKCKCPYCDEELKLSCFEPPFCEPCGIEFTICPKCGHPVKTDEIKTHKC